MPRDARSEPAAEPYLPDGPTPLPWSQAVQRITSSGTFWLATTSPDGHPHMAPILAVWAAGAPHFAVSPTSRKARNLAGSRHCVLSTTADGLDIVVEGTTKRMTDNADLHPIADAYATQHGWKVDIRNSAFYAEGAPTAGPPPYNVYRIIPTVAYGFPSTGEMAPTRWRF